MPEQKEPSFFAQYPENPHPDDQAYHIAIRPRVPESWEAYQQLFRGARGKRAIGEASVCYLYQPEISIPLIKKYLGEVKIIIGLRNPVERAYSAYTFFKRDAFEKLPFEEALAQEEARLAQGWDRTWAYKDIGLYYEKVKAYQENFSEVYIYLFDDLKANPLRVMNEVCHFLEINAQFDFSGIIQKSYNISGKPKSFFIHKLLTFPSRLKTWVKPLIHLFPREARRSVLNYLVKQNLDQNLETMPTETRAYLQDFFREDILKLESLLERDLSVWLAPTYNPD